MSASKSNSLSAWRIHRPVPRGIGLDATCLWRPGRALFLSNRTDADFQEWRAIGIIAERPVRHRDILYNHATIAYSSAFSNEHRPRRRSR
jgi:hypothetical protein